MTPSLKYIYKAWQQHLSGQYHRTQWQWSVLIFQDRLKVSF